MKRLSPRELALIALYSAYGALVVSITSLRWEQAVTGLAGISAITPLFVIWLYRK